MFTRTRLATKTTVLALAAFMAVSAPMLTASAPAEAAVKIKINNVKIRIGGFGYGTWYGPRHCHWLKDRYFLTGNPYWFNRWVYCKTH